jgi:hypothetical protein
MNSTHRSLPASPPLPWYRFFLPWLALMLVSSAVIASLVSAYYAVHTQDVVLDHADASN